MSYPSHSPSALDQQWETHLCPAERDIDVVRRLDNVVVRSLIELRRRDDLLLSDIVTFLQRVQSSSERSISLHLRLYPHFMDDEEIIFYHKTSHLGLETFKKCKSLSAIVAGTNIFSNTILNMMDITSSSEYTGYMESSGILCFANVFELDLLLMKNGLRCEHTVCSM